MEVGPGDWVECINTRDYADMIRVGQIFLVEEVGEARVPTCLALRGLRSRRGHKWARADSFRPIYRPRTSFLESLKAPPQRVKEDA